ncbi:MAG TPA: hypothetical protein VK157_15395, partial [Phycisphaerales bacterium]|nr:hypothetical protein [Phycisphaerales bacterium]
MSTVRAVAQAAADAARGLGALSTSAKNAVLMEVARRVEAARDEVLAANVADMEAARASGLASAKLRRLEVTSGSFAQAIAGIGEIAKLADPVGQVTSDVTRPNGLRVRRVRTPL